MSARVADHHDRPDIVLRTEGLDPLGTDSIRNTLNFYDSNGWLERRQYAEKDSVLGMLVWMSQQDWLYDTAGRMTEEIYQYYDNGTFVNLNRHTYGYDSLGNMITHDQDDWGGSTWDPSFKEAWDHTYDGQGRYTAILYRDAYSPAFNWNNVELNEYSYNTSGQWDTVTTTPYGSGLPKRSIYASWHDWAERIPEDYAVETFIGMWFPTLRFDRTFSTNQSYDVQTDTWNGIAWQPQFRSTFVNDAQLHRTLAETFQIDTTVNGTLLSRHTFQNSYDTWGRMTQRIAKMVEYQLNDSIEYVEHFTYLFASAESPSGSAIAVWPNPCTGDAGFKVQSELGGQVHVYDAAGRLRMAGSLDGAHALEVLPPASWAAGTYLIVVDGADGTRQNNKLVLQR